VDNVNGFSYVMSNFQDAGDAMILPDALKSQVEPRINKDWDNKKAGSVGYLSGIPTMKQMVDWKVRISLYPNSVIWLKVKARRSNGMKAIAA
jgi:hypothetical protein